MKKTFPILLLICAFFSCKPDRKTMLERTWRARVLNNPQMDDIMTNGQRFIDTLGTHTDAQLNMELYGTNNMDSLKKNLQMQLDSVKAMQQHTVEQTVFTFKKDGVAVLHFNGSTDSSKWSLGDNNIITLDDVKDKNGAPDKITMEIVELTDTSLKLNFQENGASSVVTFDPDEK